MRCFASTTATPFLFIYLLFFRSWSPYFSPVPRLLAQKPRALALALVPSPGCARDLLRPGPVLMLKLKLLAQAQGFGHPLPFLPSAKSRALASRLSLLLALANRWPLLLAPPSRWSIPTRQFASTSPQSSWTIYSQPGWIWRIHSKADAKRSKMAGDVRQPNERNWSLHHAIIQ
jgi:hypothetical protein